MNLWVPAVFFFRKAWIVFTCWQNTRSKNFVNWILIITPVFKLDETRSSWSHSGPIIYASFNFTAQPFRYTHHHNRENMFNDWKSIFSWEETPWETCIVRLWNKNLPCPSVIVVCVMSVWQGHCLPWQPLTKNPPFHSLDKMSKETYWMLIYPSKMFP